MKAEDVHKMSDQELTVSVEQLRRQWYDLRSQAVTEKLENPRQLTSLRRDIARVLTERNRRSAQVKGA